MCKLEALIITKFTNKSFLPTYRVSQHKKDVQNHLLFFRIQNFKHNVLVTFIFISGKPNYKTTEQTLEGNKK